MSCRRSRRAASQRGAALVLALLVFALAAALMVGLQRDFQLQLQRASNSVVAEQVWSYLLGAEALASIALRVDAENDSRSNQPVDDLNEIWAQPATPYALDEGGWLSGQLEDLQGRFNVNALAGSGADAGGDAPVARFSVYHRMMIRLLQALDGVPVSQAEAIALTEAVADFIDADGQPRPDGAEDDTYRGLPLPYLAANRPLSSVSELRAVRGMTPEIYRALAPHITVWPAEGGQVNWRTATPVVFRAFNADDVLEPMPVGEAQRLLQIRGEGGLSDRETLLADSFLNGRDTAGLGTVLADRSDWFLLAAEVEIADRVRRLYSVLRRNGSAVAVIYRSNSEP